MNSAYLALLVRVSELARRYGLRPSEAEAKIDYVRAAPDATMGHYRLSFEGPPGGSGKAEKFSKMKAALGCEENAIETNFLDEMEDVVDRAMSLAPRARTP